MISRHSSLSLLALLSCISTVVAGPIHNGLYKRGRNVLIGYRYVSKQKADEYNAYGRLTGVGASGTQLGDGAYISPTINEWQVADDYWQCAIFADETKFRNVAKMYIPQNSNTFFSSSRLSSYLGQARLDPASTVLWSKIDGDPDQHIQMVIPPYYLAKSPAFRGAWGNGDLGISVICVPKNQQNNNYYGNANWGGEWNIPGYSCDFARKRDGSDSCPLPSPAGPIEIPSSVIPVPSSDISTVSSYSFTETPITATSTALPSDMSLRLFVRVLLPVTHSLLIRIWIAFWGFQFVCHTGVLGFICLGKLDFICLGTQQRGRKLVWWRIVGAEQRSGQLVCSRIFGKEQHSGKLVCPPVVILGEQTSILIF
ncbi:hypothetical protein C8R44DRAFT_976136 [Mycena epipterygia]|nr:hypothetical protein C8R44DRAFT_976136 [Mycena epipterygia]